MLLSWSRRASQIIFDAEKKTFCATAPNVALGWSCCPLSFYQGGKLDGNLIMFKTKIICAAATIAASCLYKVGMSNGAAVLNAAFRFRMEIVTAPIHSGLLSF